MKLITKKMAALVSLIFSSVTIRTGNLYFAIALHAAWNLFQGYVFGVAVSGHPAEGIYSMELSGGWLSGSSFGLEGSAITTLVLACTLLVFVPVRRSCRTGSRLEDSLKS